MIYNDARFVCPNPSPGQMKFGNYEELKSTCLRTRYVKLSNHSGDQLQGEAPTQFMTRTSDEPILVAYSGSSIAIASKIQTIPFEKGSSGCGDVVLKGTKLINGTCIYLSLWDDTSFAYFFDEMPGYEMYPFYEYVMRKLIYTCGTYLNPETGVISGTMKKEFEIILNKYAAITD